jgi:hypothetical protein
MQVQKLCYPEYSSKLNAIPYKFRKILAVLMLLYGSERWAVNYKRNGTEAFSAL